MQVEEFVGLVEDRGTPLPEEVVRAFEAGIGARLPIGYRRFLMACNGGHLGGSVTFSAGGIESGIHHIYGLRKEPLLHFQRLRETYQTWPEIRVSLDLLPIMDDSFGNKICLGLRKPHWEAIFFWDHEIEDSLEDGWDGSIEQAGNLTLLAPSFLDFVALLEPPQP